MVESWEIHWKDYYQILQVQPTAESEVIKAAFDRLARKYHPDVNNKISAVQKMQELNEAFEILGTPVKRSSYDLAYRSQQFSIPNNSTSQGSVKPRPAIHPSVIRFSNVKPGEIHQGRFIVTNAGGPFKRIQINATHSWIRILRQTHLNPPEKLPLEIVFEAQVEELNSSYFNNFIVKLDDEEASTRLELTTLSESTQQEAPDIHRTPKTQTRNKPGLKTIIALLIIVVIIVVSVIIWQELQPILDAWRSLLYLRLP